MNALQLHRAAFLTKNVSTFQDLSSVHVKMGLPLAAPVVVKHDQKVLVVFVS